MSVADERVAEIRQLLTHGAHHLIADRDDVRWLLVERERLIASARMGWSTVCILAVAHGAPASERAAREALDALDKAPVSQ